MMIRIALEEDRLLLADFAENSVLLISFTEPDAETVRIISARRANKHEEKNTIMEIVSYTLETAHTADREEMNRLAAMKDEDVDYSDIPPLDTLSLRPRPPVDRGMYRPLKVAVTCKLDADIVPTGLNRTAKAPG